jgi:hypothetical protein
VGVELIAGAVTGFLQEGGRVGWRRRERLQKSVKALPSNSQDGCIELDGCGHEKLV